MNTLDHQEARGLLEEVNQIKSTTRARLHATGWQWLIVWAITFSGAALTGMVPAWMPYAELYWKLATPIAIVVTAIVSIKVDSRSPLRVRSWPYWAVGLAITVATFAASSVLSDEAVIVAVWVLLGLGFAAFSWLERLAPAAWLLAGMSVVAAVLGFVVEDTFQLYPALALAFSAALAGIIAGLKIQSGK